MTPPARAQRPRSPYPSTAFVSADLVSAWVWRPARPRLRARCAGLLSRPPPGARASSIGAQPAAPDSLSSENSCHESSGANEVYHQSQMPRLVSALLISLTFALAAACGDSYDDDSATPTTETITGGQPMLRTIDVRIDDGATITVEVAHDPEERTFGLSERSG